MKYQNKNSYIFILEWFVSNNSERIFDSEMHLLNR